MVKFMRHSRVPSWVMYMPFLLAGMGCLDRDLVALNPCLVSGVSLSVNVANIDKVDVLFMIDNSNSMEDKQKNLREHVPQLVQTLVTGMRFPNDPDPFPPVKDLHIGVVDSDMGLPGVNGIPGCVGFGHDGLFQHTPFPSTESPTCDPVYPSFLSYAAGSATGPSAAKFEQDFGCIANVGVTGCGFEQQLEATLKALWPSVYVDPTGNVASQNPITFLAESGSAQSFGHGDKENTGFLRNNPTTGLSLLVIIELSDEDDGSTSDMQLYTPAGNLPANTWLEPLSIPSLNLRSIYGNNRNHLYPTSRYVQAFKALRPGNENLVVYAAITGVPLDLVDSTASGKVDFANATQRDAYYDGILADSRMQHVPDGVPAPKTFEVTACQTGFGHGYPGRRYVEVAKGIGENSTVYSICEADYTPAINNVIDLIAKQLRAVCLPRPLIRTSAGTVACNVVWELPTAANRTTAETPVSCSERPYLSVPGAGHALTSASGGEICTVTQLPVVGRVVNAGEGWYYDNFSDALKQSCNEKTPQRVSFTASARPPTGVNVRLECLEETQLVVDDRADVVPGPSGQIATIGTSCELAATSNVGAAAGSGAAGAGAVPTAVDPDSLCLVYHANGTVEHSMICHPQTNTCARTCSSPTDCPAAWTCDKRDSTLMATTSATRPQGAAVCVNPTCGTE